ncbi:MAG: ABC transporter permease [Armatimonadetes bacterium]|nr:MAG: ABC transporter permease [Armatimonadota bacterium]MCE7899905.1 ABC transporter permease [Armatimonadetes bacterium ATM1]MDL1928642.1 ABC transporter permease [Fimbriimonadia bacterium ATM]MBC6968776.1 ABC transporter permease [Armatimonadota bacterium]MBL1150532.1 ABC transporter permease [Armatimonadota bacterium]
MKRDFLFGLGVAFLALILLVAVFGPMRYSVTDAVGSKFEPPSADHWLGTDHLGRDVFCRLAYGARMSLLIGIAVQGVAIFFGLLVGTASGYGRRWVDNILMRFTDGMFAFPDILLAILIMGVLRSTNLGFLESLPKMISATLPVFAALAVVGWPSMARLIRNQVLSLKEQEFVVASRALGASHWHVVRRHILPHLWGLVLAVAMVGMAMVILAEGSLSFLGIGIPPPWPSWGSMINDARSYMASHPLLLAWPCLTLSLTILALNFVGDGLRDRYDPKLRTKS